MIFLDIESCGFTGPPLTIQWAEDDGPIHIHDVWEDTAATVKLIERLCSTTVCAYNLPFDWFHVQRLYDVLAGPSTWSEVVPGGPCVKPQGALDLYLHMLKGTLQPLRERKRVRVRQVPEVAAPILRDKLEIASAQWPEILAAQWKVLKSDRGDGWRDVVLSFNPSKSMKSVAKHVLGVEVYDLPVPEEIRPKDECDWLFTDTSKWEPHFEAQLEFWRTNDEARRYAAQDIDLLRQLWRAEGCPEGDYDSELAVSVACARYKGFRVDIPKMEVMAQELREIEGSVAHDHHSVLRELKKVVPPIIEVTKTNDQVIGDYEPFAPEYVAKVRRARSAKKTLDILEKILKSGRAHPTFHVVGTLTGRMSGAGNLSYHGIPKGGGERALFPLADEGEEASGGDFAGFEVAIAAALFDDEALTQKLKEGQKFHALYGADVYGMSYDEIMEDKEKYGAAKGAVFATFYGAQAPKIASVLGVDLEDAIEGKERLMDSYPGIRREQDFVQENYATLNQKDGGAITWREPLEYVESMFGYRRSFQVEILVAKTLYDVAERLEIPIDGTVLRKEHKGPQTFSGACRSACYGAAFQVQAAVARVAGNHRIQATGAELCKRLQARIQRLQPAGIHPWLVRTFQVHDEILVVHAPEVGDEVTRVVEEFVLEFQEQIPMLAIDWSRRLNTWADK